MTDDEFRELSDKAWAMVKDREPAALWTKHLARLIEQRTIERCAKVCEEWALIYGDTETGRARKKTALVCAAIIRGLKNER
jgi:hypothetical protein